MSPRAFTPKEIAREAGGSGLEQEVETIMLSFASSHEYIRECRDGIISANKQIRDLVEKYNDDRYTLLISRLLEQGLGWCVECKRPRAFHDLKLLGRETTRQLNHNAWPKTCSCEDGFHEHYFELYTACPECYEAAFDDRNARRIEITNEGLRMRVGRELKPLPEKVGARPLPYPDHTPSWWSTEDRRVLENLAKRFLIPPRITFAQGLHDDFPRINIGDIAFGNYDSPQIVLSTNK